MLNQDCNIKQFESVNGHINLYVVNEYSLNYEFEISDYDDDDDDTIIERIDFVRTVAAFTNKKDAEDWINKQELDWSGQYEIEGTELL